jgi:carboxypeptidase PM20D1
MSLKTSLLAATIFSLSSMTHAAPLTDPKIAASALDVLTRSIAFRTVEGQGQVPAYAAYLASVLTAAGFDKSDISIVPRGETATLVARYRGSDQKLKPIILCAHMDVVEAVAKDWTRDPFKPVVENGFVYGRGASDNKFDVSMMVSTLARLKREGFKPKRDIILALSGDEETQQATTQLLAQELKNAELLLNGDAGGGMLDESGKPVVYAVQAAEKTYADYEIYVTDAGGHSSRPGKNNAIYTLAKAIDKIAAYQFPAQSSELTRAYFTATSAKTPGALGDAMRRFAKDATDAQAVETLSANPEYIGQVRTTCVATMLTGGHALNALPQRASVSVNCRIFPGVDPSTVQAKLLEVIGDPAIKLTVIGTPIMSDASPLRPDVMSAIRKAINLRSPGLPIVPNMSPGATDSLFFRNLGVPSYGVSGIFMDPADDFAHGLNERVPVASIDGALAQWKSMIMDLSK